MKLRTPHDLLVYLVELSDSERSWVLLSGKHVIDAARQDGHIEWTDGDLDQLAQFFFALRDDGEIEFVDTMASFRGQHQRVGANDMSSAQDIRVRGQGRLAVQSSRPSVSIGQLALGNISNLDLTVVLNLMEQQIESADVPEDTKEEARGKLRAVREAAADVGTGAAGDLIGAALRQVLGLGG